MSHLRIQLSFFFFLFYHDSPPEEQHNRSGAATRLHERAQAARGERARERERACGLVIKPLRGQMSIRIKSYFQLFLFYPIVMSVCPPWSHSTQRGEGFFFREVE